MESGTSEKEGMASTSGSGKCDAAEDTSPDSLRNTPSNIKRLANEIEQFEGRHKYLAQTKSPSDGGDVRWYFCKLTLALNELAASVPRTEIVGKGDYFRFGMRDSLAIEASFLQREDDLLSRWWQEYAECSEGPAGLNSNVNEQFKGLYEESAETDQTYGIEEERVGVPVKGGLHEVDLVKRHCFPVYWPGDSRRVLRGHWFARKGGLDWLPIREDVAEQLEFAYRSKVWRRRTFQPSGLFAARIDLQGSTPGLHALFTGEDDTWEAWLNAEASGFANVISMGGSGVKLRRGYAPSPSAKPTQDELRQQKEEEMDDYCSQVPVGHLVFMVHGIGQRLEKSNLVDDVGDFRVVIESLAERHLTSYQRGTQRVLFIPCQWRKGLKLSGEHAVEKLTLDGVRKLRVALSATVHDVLYYMSPIYCQTIIDSVSNQLNRLYLKFLKRNPGYDGKVSIFGHSLGSVLSYDILCHQDVLSSPFPMEWMYKEKDVNDLIQDGVSGLSCDCNLVPHIENKDSDHDGKNKSSSTNFENLGDKQDKGFNKLLNPSSFGLDDATSSDLNHPKENDIPSSDQSTCEHDGINDNISSGMETVDEHTRNKAEAVQYVANKSDDEVDESNNEKMIQLLQEEVVLLKAKINDLESQYRGKLEKIQSVITKAMSLSHPAAGALNSYTPRINYTKLEFKVDTFFAAGSPLGVFLALRNVRIGVGKGQNYWVEEDVNEEMPACRRMFNIFHPFDPVAYRVEPLICKEHLKLRPVIIPYHRGGKRLHVGFQEFTEGLALRSQAFKGYISSVRVKVLTICESRNKDSQDDESETTPANEEKSYGSLMMERLTGSEDGRIDHALQDKTFRHPYLSALGSHTNYWRDYDTALFVLKHLYQDVPEGSQYSHGPQEGSSKDARRYKGWSVQRDEELPLTFADKGFLKDFSVSARRYMK